MPREQRLAIKVNHCIEIWSPVNFHMLRNKTRVYREDNSRWTSLHLSVLFHGWPRLIETDMGYSPPKKKKLDYILKCKHEYNNCGKPFSFLGVVCWLRLGNSAHCLMVNKQENPPWPTADVHSDKRVCWNCTAETRRGCFVVKQMFTEQTLKEVALRHCPPFEIPFEFQLYCAWLWTDYVILSP